MLMDHLIALGVTSMSAGSSTEPGGYTQHSGSEGQFQLSDHRSPAQINDVIRSQGYEPVWKDWDAGFCPLTDIPLQEARKEVIPWK